MTIIAIAALGVHIDMKPAHAVDKGRITFCTYANGAYTCFDTNKHCKVYQSDFNGTKCRSNSQ